MDGLSIRKRYRRRIALIAVILSVGILLMGGVLLYLSSDLRKIWNDYSEQSESRNTALAELHRAVGYGGFIHNFKNYVLRKETSTLDNLNQDLDQAFAVLNAYAGLSLNAEEYDALQTLRVTLSKYRQSVNVAIQAVASGDAIALIDQRVRIDDAPALQALGILQDANHRYTSDISKQLNDQLILLINALLVGLLAMPFVVLAAYHYHDILGKVVDLSIQKKQVEKALLDTAQKAVKAEEKHQEMAHEAYHCDLTKIANRKAFMKQGQAMLQCAEQNQQSMSVLFVDVDDFKNINDHYGHEVGDQVLVEVASRLRLALREDDLVARIGGDEFALIAQGRESYACSKRLADRLIEVMNQSYSHLADGLEVSCSVGGAIFPEEGTNLEALIRVADERMYCVKKSGKNGVYLQDA